MSHTSPDDSRPSGEARASQARVLGDYVVLAELARGGMGRVYLARKSGQAGFARLFAIKVMSHQLEDDREALSMLLDEAHIASRLHHPNVVSVVDIGSEDGSYYLVMDYVEGGSLHALLRRHRGARPARLLVPIVLEALHGLHAVHSLTDPEGVPYGVVHRDISPHNLLVGVDGGCRVIDFGIAKATARFTDTQAGVHKGKLAYMAPEQMRGEPDLDRRVDVWATGVTLYVALTGHHPFRAENDASTIHNVIGGTIPLPSTFGAPLALDRVVMRALERDREARWPTAQAFGDALREVALAEGLLGAPAEVAAWVQETLGDELSKRRRLIAATADPPTRSGTVALPRLWSTPDTTGSRNAAAPAPTSSPPPARARMVPWIAAAILGVALGTLALVWSKESPPAEEGAAPTAEPTREASTAEPGPATEREVPSTPAPAPEALPEPTALTDERAVDARSIPAASVGSRLRGPRGRARPTTASAPEGRPALDEPPTPPVAPVSPEPHVSAAPSAAPPPPSAEPAPPAPARSALETNPYLRGE
ncbi:MAG: protein kinase [Sandaracinus sp.]